VVFGVQNHAAAIGLLEAADHADEGSLAGTAFADEADGAAVGHLERDMVKRREGCAVAALESYGDVLCGKQGVSLAVSAYL
jgi:hypothetical protein